MITDNEKCKCTGCGGCDGRCGLGIDVRRMLALYNDFLDGRQDEVLTEIAQIPEEQRPDRCFGCGACQFFCPEKIEIWETLGRFANLLKIC